MPLKYYIPTSLDHALPVILRYIAYIGLIIIAIASLCSVQASAIPNIGTISEGIYENTANIVSSTGYDYSKIDGAYKSSYSTDMTKKDAFLFEYKKTSVSFRPNGLYLKTKPDQGRTVSIVLSKLKARKLNYDGILGGDTKYVLTTSWDNVKEELILSSNPFPAASKSDSLIFEHVFNYTGLTAYVDGNAWDEKTTVTTVNKIEFKSGSKTFFSFSQPNAYDGDNNRIWLSYTLSKKGSDKLISISIPMSYMNDAVYPVTIDPTVVQDVNSFNYVVVNSTNPVTQSITVPNMSNITTVDYFNTSSVCYTTQPCAGYLVISNSTGYELLNQSFSAPSNVGTLYQNFNVLTPVYLTHNVTYNFTIKSIDSLGHAFYWYYTDTNPYSGGRAYDTNGTIDASYDMVFTAGFNAEELLYPLNDTIINKTYPPLTTPVTFLWDMSKGMNSHVVVARDVNFNLISVDITTSSHNSTQYLTAGDYWWKVQSYNTSSGTYGSYTNTSNFTINESSPVNGTGIQGTIYEMIGGIQTPVSGATVYIYNNTLSQSTITGSNGYYLFTGLNNTTTYNLYASKQGYDTTPMFPVTTGINTIVTNNILIKIYISPYVPNFVFEKFVVRTYFDGAYPGITVSIFKNNDVIAYKTGITDSMGQVVFELIKDQYYRVEFSGGGLANTITDYFYAKEESYLLTVPGGFPTKGNLNTDVTANLSVIEINSTHSILSLFYRDNTSTTSIINFYAKNYTTGNYSCISSSTSQTVTINCTVISTGVYQFGYNATNTKYGFMQRDTVVNFAAKKTTDPQVIGTKVSSDILNWISILGLIFIAGLFSVINLKFGVLIVPAVATFLYWAGTLLVNGVIVHIAFVLGILVYLRMSESKVVY